MTPPLLPLQLSMDPIDLKSMPRELKAGGWCFIPQLAESPAGILALLGPLLPSRDGRNYHDLKPYDRELAPPASMSAIIGTDEQPMHTDAAYLPLPPRYLALQCLEPGEARCPTNVWPIELERLKRDRPAVLTKAHWVASGGGLRPIYCSVMDVQSGAVRVRFDPLCMRTVHKGDEAAGEVEHLLNKYSEHIVVEWHRGALLILDNWRCLHARGRGSDNAPSRQLRRWTIGASDGLVG